MQQPLNDEVCTHTFDFSYSLMCGHVQMRTVKHTGYAGRWCLAGANGCVQWMLQCRYRSRVCGAQKVHNYSNKSALHCVVVLFWCVLLCVSQVPYPIGCSHRPQWNMPLASKGRLLSRCCGVSLLLRATPSFAMICGSQHLSIGAAPVAGARAGGRPRIRFGGRKRTLVASIAFTMRMYHV